VVVAVVLVAVVVGIVPSVANARLAGREGLPRVTVGG
jgi:hypothetical protein